MHIHGASTAAADLIREQAQARQLADQQAQTATTGAIPLLSTIGGSPAPAASGTAASADPADPAGQVAGSESLSTLLAAQEQEPASGEGSLSANLAALEKLLTGVARSTASPAPGIVSATA